MKQYAIAGLVVVGVLALGTAITRLTVSALPEPGQTETFLATKAKHLLVQNGTRQGVPQPPRDAQAALKEGDTLFSNECASCHGASGYDLTDAGRWMYPRAADLTSRESQSYSDQEVFWIIKNGIRMSGMPAFGKVESDEHIWDLALYVRNLPKTVPKPQAARR